MFLAEIKNKETLDVFVSQSHDGQFLQSWEWGEFQQSLGRQVWRVGVYKSLDDKDDEQKIINNSELRAVATIIEHPLPLGLGYLYCPYGPVYLDGLSVPQREEATKLILSELRSITIETKNYLEIFARIEPRVTWEETGNFFVNLKMKKTSAIQPQDTQVVNLQTTPEELLKQMHSKTRYNIRLAEKKGVVVREVNSLDDFEYFWQLMEVTAQRDGFHTHEKKYYLDLWQTFYSTLVDADNMDLSIKILLAEVDNKPIAALMLGIFGGKAIYLHGASDDKYKAVMAPHLLQFEVMKLAHNLGCQSYDLWGVKPDNRHLSQSSKEDKWAGITRFKKGFGGQEVNYIGAWDFVYDQKLYWIYKLGRKFL